MTSKARRTATELIAVIVAVTEDEPRVLTINDARALPSGPILTTDRSLQSNLRNWVEQQTRHPLGYMEQLYTFADRDRTDDGRQIISISYLGLTREALSLKRGTGSWQSWYSYFPWEEQRQTDNELVYNAIVPRLRAWAGGAPDKKTKSMRQERIATVFGQSKQAWNEEFILQRYEVMYEAGVFRDVEANAPGWPLGKPMLHDHRRILATGIARLRAKIRYRPVIFEMMPAAFTLLQLQRAVEAIVGRPLHKQNFRRMIDHQSLIEETGDTSTETGGRPAKLFKFKEEIVLERAALGSKLPLAPR